MPHARRTLGSRAKADDTGGRGTWIANRFQITGLWQTTMPDQLQGRVAAILRVIGWGTLPFGALLDGALKARSARAPHWCLTRWQAWRTSCGSPGPRADPVGLARSDRGSPLGDVGAKPGEASPCVIRLRLPGVGDLPGVYSPPCRRPSSGTEAV